MADLSENEFKTVIEDARARHSAVVALIYHTDQQASGLLRLFLTLGLAAASATYAVYKTNMPLAVALATAALTTTVGAVFCLMAMASAKIRLPGYDPDFWLWANRADVPQTLVLQKYLEQLQSGTELNAPVNRNTSQALKYAKGMVVVTLLAAMIAGAIAARF
jgi:hypothetical protein